VVARGPLAHVARRHHGASGPRRGTALARGPGIAQGGRTSPYAAAPRLCVRSLGTQTVAGPRHAHASCGTGGHVMSDDFDGPRQAATIHTQGQTRRSRPYTAQGSRHKDATTQRPYMA
jgi:hypothetical protein